MVAAPFVAAALVVGAWLAGLVFQAGAPWWSTAAALTVSAVAMVASKRTAVRALWFNTAFVVAALAIAVHWLDTTDERERRQQAFGDSEGLFEVDETLGVRPRAGHRTTASLHYDGELVYDVTYTIGDDRLRIAPPAPDATDCVLFFGGSFTFGEGVDDDETTAWRVGTASADDLRTRNFGFAGYGPHQMLAAIEAGLVEAAPGCRPRLAVYQAVYHHVLRSAGKWSWDWHGPRYVLSGGEAVRDGHFDFAAQTSRPELVAGLPDDSFLARQLEERPEDVGVDQVTEADVELFHAIVATSARRLKQRYPGVEFHVLYWDRGDSVGPVPVFGDAIEADLVSVHPVSGILPPSDDWQRDYKLPHDVHPRARTHELMAAYVVDRILGGEPAPQANDRSP